jgi:formyl-CoA transferase
MGRIDAAIAAWSSVRSLEECLAQLGEARVPAGKIYTVKDIVEDRHYQARDMLREVTLNDGSQLKVPGVVPKLSATPGRFEGGGPDLGQHTEAVLKSLGLDAARLSELKEKGVI